MKRQASDYPLFWSFSSDPEKQAACQAKLMQYQWDNFEEKLDIPPHPNVSKGAWQATMDEVDPELERLMKKPPSHPKGEGYKP